MSSNSFDRFGRSPPEGIKSPVVVESTGNLVLAATQLINTVNVQLEDRVLVKDQTNPLENGIYVVKAQAWERSVDMNDETDMKSGMLVASAHTVTLYMMTYTGIYQPGITTLTFTVI